jgi:hypothetical protein
VAQLANSLSLANAHHFCASPQFSLVSISAPLRTKFQSKANLDFYLPTLWIPLHFSPVFTRIYPLQQSPSRLHIHPNTAKMIIFKVCDDATPPSRVLPRSKPLLEILLDFTDGYDTGRNYLLTLSSL